MKYWTDAREIPDDIRCPNVIACHVFPVEPFPWMFRLRRLTVAAHRRFEHFRTCALSIRPLTTVSH
jgi:hypothetical protein